jgi:CBS-domain-containing membrane protein
MNNIPSIGSVMTPYTAQVDDSLRRARASMVEHGVRHLPVKDGDSLVGILTDRDGGGNSPRARENSQREGWVGRSRRRSRRS